MSRSGPRAGALCALLAVAALAGADDAPSAGAAYVTVSLSDGRTLERAVLRPGPAPDSVLLKGPEAPAAPLGIRELLAVDFNRPDYRAGGASVRLTNGDQVAGEVSFPTSRQVRVETGWGVLTVPLAWCVAIRLREGAPLPDGTDRDTVHLEKDRVTGEIRSLSEGKLRLDLGGSLVELPLEKVVALTPGRTRAAAADAVVSQALRVTLDLGGGERVSGRWLGLSGDQVTLQSDWDGRLQIPLDSLHRLEVKNGRVIYLSELQPTEVRETPFLDGTHPFQADRAVSGRPLRLGGKAYRRGLGVHSRTELTYTLDGGFETLAAMIGVDDFVGEHGSVVFRVFGDGKLLHESPVMRGGDPPRQLRVPIRGVLSLRLVADYADGGDAADHADWADARLLRP